MIGDSIGGMMAQRYAAQQQAAYNQSLCQLQQAWLSNYFQDSILGRSKTREQRIKDMERDLSSWLNRNEKITINL